MSRLPKAQSDLVKRGRGWKCGNKGCKNGQGGKRASIKSGGGKFITKMATQQTTEWVTW